ncbi:hypothetical protein DMN41_13335, partial [Clostridium perfringens]
MKEIYLLTTYLLKAFLKDTLNQEKKYRDSILKIILGAMILTFFIFFTSNLYRILSNAGIEHVLISLILTASSIVFMIIGIYLVLSNFSFANDNEFLLSLPLNKEKLFISKFLFIQITLLPICILIFILLSIYGILSQSSITFYIYTLIVSLLTPITPVVYCIFITLILNKLVLKINSKEFIQRIFTITSIIFSIGIVYFAIKSFMSPDNVIALVNKNNSFSVNFINIIFPLNIYLTKALTYSDFLIGLNSISISIVLSIFLIILSICIGKRLYYKIMLNSNSVSEVNGFKKYSYCDDSDSILIILIKRDFLTLIRSSQFFLYTIGMFPILVLIVCTFIPIFQAFVNIDSLQNNYIVIYIYLMSLSALFASFNVTASTSFSREGRYLPLLLQMPIDIKTILLSKIIVSLAVSSLMIILNLVVLVFLNLPILVYILIGLSMFIFTSFIVMVSVFNDVSNPNIRWCYEKDLVKDNISLYKSGIYMIICTPC